ncbi:MAG: hypothetical protein AAF813_02535 [Pseudomonadota bacterium]
MEDKQHAQHIERRVADYVHRAKRMTIELFGTDTSHDHNLIAVQLASAMVQLDAADRIAAASKPPLRLKD